MNVIPTKYKGILFKSKLEAQCAEWLDNWEIPWEYEPEGFRLGDGGTLWYLPDFWLPECKTILECKGFWDKPSVTKIYAFYKEAYPEDITVAVCERKDNRLAVGLVRPTPGDTWFGCNGTHEGRVELDYSDVILAHCESCDQCWFMTNMGDYKCLSCGVHDGTGHFKAYYLSHTQNPEVFSFHQNEDGIVTLYRESESGWWKHD